MNCNLSFHARIWAPLLVWGACKAPHILAQPGAPKIANAKRDTKTDALRQGWQSPPEASKPHVYWYWLNNVVTKNGISKDLEAMAKSGIGGAYIGHIGGFNDVPGNSLVKGFSDEWYELMQHAVREGQRTGVQIGVFNGPGWSQSGGPWVKAEDSMTYIDLAEVRAPGGERFDAVLPRAPKALADVRVIAFPAPPNDGEILQPVRVFAEADETLQVLSDGRAHVLPEKKTYAPLRLTWEFAAPQTVRSIAFTHKSGQKVAGKIAVSDDGESFKPMRDFTLDRRGGAQVLFANRPSTVSISPTTAKFFRIEMPWNTDGAQNGNSLGIAFSQSARLEMAEEKQLGVASKLNTPPWNTFTWPASPEPEAGVVAPAQVVDLTAKMQADGRLIWDVPAGNWIIQRFSTIPTGARSSPTSADMGGLEIDKMSREAATRHINQGMVGELWRRLKPQERSGFNYAIADSYEQGFQNWTPTMEREFQARYKYDPLPYLPVLSGRVVGSAAQSDRFLWDLRRLVADLIAVNYVGGLREAVHPLGLKLWLEPYGHWGFPGEFLNYGGQSDGIGGEFWRSGDLGPTETRAAASAAHIYGKNRVSAEAFTSAGSPFEKPGDLKMRGDWAFTQGINHFVLHVVSHQPTDVPGPGLQLLWGTYFNRNSLWFNEHGRAWTDYVRRTSYLLQQGRAVADVAYFIGEDVPQMTGILQPQLPGGYDYDFINAEVLLSKARVEKGRLTLPGGSSYGVLVLPPNATMRPELLERISQMVKQGLTIVGPAPTRSPSLQNYPRADLQVKTLATQLWATGNASSHKVGLGRVWKGAPLREVLSAIGVTPAIVSTHPSVLWKQRSAPDAEIFYLSNQSQNEINIAPSFRISNRAPQIWDAETARIESIAAYRESAGRTIVPITLGPAQSVFVVFRRATTVSTATPTTTPTAIPVAVTDVQRDGEPVFNWSGVVQTVAKTAALEKVEIADSNLFQSFLVRPRGEIRLPAQKLGSVELAGQRWIVAPPQGNAERGSGYAGSGVSVGRNGVVVMQHWSDNAPAVLVWQSPAPLTDWTHVVVAYQNGVPQLYVNGKLVQSGLRSGQRLIAGEAGDGDLSGSPHEKQVRAFQTGWRDLDAAQIAALSRDVGRARSVTRVVRAPGGSLRLQTNQAGQYQLRLSNGQILSAKIAAPPAPQPVDGPWDVSFSGVAAPSPARWKRLQSWSESSDDATKYFSGSAIYTTTFDLPAHYNRAQSLAMLDLGEVEAVARVAVNGQTAGTALRAPYQLDISSFIKPGQNRLRVVVTGNWINRMVGDDRFPDDLAELRHKNGNLTKWPAWALNGSPRPEPRRTILAARRFATKETPLQTSGLIGPVTLSFERNIALASTLKAPRPQRAGVTPARQSGQSQEVPMLERVQSRAD